MFLSPDQVAAYRADGFLVLPELLTADECATIGAAMDEVVAEAQAEARAAGKSADEILNHGVFVGLSVRHELFRRIARDPRLVDPLESIWGPEIGFLSDKVVYKSAAVDFGTPWHQDWQYWLGSHKITIWIAIDPATPENGCLMLVPGSHHAPIDHDRVQDSRTGFGHRLDLAKLGLDREPVTVPLPPGSAVLFHDLTLHASTPNTAGLPRRALAVTYRNLAEPDLEYPALPAAARVRGEGLVAR